MPQNQSKAANLPLPSRDQIDELWDLESKNAATQALLSDQISKLAKRMDTFDSPSGVMVTLDQFRYEMELISHEVRNLAERQSKTEAEVGEVKADYMPKGFWFTILYPTVVATIPALVVGILFYIITIFVRP